MHPVPCCDGISSLFRRKDGSNPADNRPKGNSRQQSREGQSLQRQCPRQPSQIQHRKVHSAVFSYRNPAQSVTNPPFTAQSLACFYASPAFFPDVVVATICDGCRLNPRVYRNCR